MTIMKIEPKKELIYSLPFITTPKLLRTYPCVCIPVAFECVMKDLSYSNTTTGKINRKLSLTTNELMQNMIEQCAKNELKWIITDSWFAFLDNMIFIHQKKKSFLMDIKSNRLIALSQKDRSAGKCIRLDELDIQPQTPVKVFLKDLAIPVPVYKQVFTTKNGSTAEMYLVTNNLYLFTDDFDMRYKKDGALKNRSLT